MENRNNILLPLLITVIIFLTWGLTKNFNEQNQVVTPQTNICKEDSLLKVINQMEVDLEMFDDGWDYKEKRYEEVLFEYEYALDYLDKYHHEVYRDIHRILAHKESYSRKDEKENKKRLKIEGNKW